MFLLKRFNLCNSGARGTPYNTQARIFMNNLLLNASAVRYLRLFGVLPLLLATDVAMANGFNCSDPNGPEEVIECYATSFAMTGEEFWDKELFQKEAKVLDGFCQKSLSATTPSPNVVETALYALSCVQNTPWVNYFSYANFIAADKELKLRLPDDYQFMRTGTLDVKKQELANFLATAAQETSGNGLLTTKYQQDGLYFRYEVAGPLRRCWDPVPNPNFNNSTAKTQVDPSVCATKTTTEFITDYYPFSTWVVAMKDGLVYTAYVSDQDCQYYLDQPVATINCYNPPPKNSTPNILPGGLREPPDGYTWQFMNKTIPSAYWLGMGNLQLTGDSMTKFFGWYYQQVDVAKPKQTADMQAFVERYLKDGILAWEGGLWNFRISGIGAPTLHSILAGDKAACHDIGITTALVNGANQCHDLDGRQLYYNYFKTSVFKLGNTPILVPPKDNKENNSYQCKPEILTYCTSK
jgi:hypothetical protein